MARIKIIPQFFTFPATNLKEETDNGATCGSSFRKESCGQNPKLASDENVHRACHYLYQQSDRGEAISHDTLLPLPQRLSFYKKKNNPSFDMLCHSTNNALLSSARCLPAHHSFAAG